MTNQSILVSIYDAVNSVKWETPLLKEKAMLICTAIFNQFIYDKDRFYTYKQFAQNYFTTITRSKKYYFIKDILVANEILECDNKYEFTKKANNGVAKGYRFNYKFFGQDNISSTGLTFTYSTTIYQSYISLYCPTQDPCIYNSTQTRFIQEYCFRNLDKLSFDESIDSHIKELSEIHANNINKNENITDQFVYITFNKQKYRYSLPKALALAEETGYDLIQYKDKCYIDNPTSFIKNKSHQLNITYCQNIFNIKNKLFYCDRNDTNNRLDYNLTGLKKELFENTLFDGERLVELDIANAQFAIAAHLNDTIDKNFVFHAQRGNLYAYIEQELNLSKGTGKELMFRVAFDKIKSNNEFEQIRCLFPKYMKWVDSYKKENGYKMFANMLQKKEAEIMIDGLLMKLIKNGYRVFPIHDAIRVKASEVAEISQCINEHFKYSGFKCLVRERQ